MVRQLISTVSQWIKEIVGFEILTKVPTKTTDIWRRPESKKFEIL